MKRLFVLASLSMALLAWLGLPAATAAPPATMTGETFISAGGPPFVFCTATGGFSFSASGVAAGPYSGTFTETGTGTVSASHPIDLGTVTAFSASFTVYSPSGDVLVNGTKNLDIAVPNTSFACLDPPNVGAAAIPTTYQATIYTAGGNYRDEGTSYVGEVFSDPSGTALLESFLSSLLEPALLLPTDKDQCKNDGWRNYGVFKNQGDCVSFVATGGKNPPGK